VADRFRSPSVRGLFPLIGCVLICGAGGCALFSEPVTLGQANKIPVLRPPPDAVALDIVFVERPVGDPLLGPDLWSQVDEVGSLPLDTRKILRDNGLRIGIVGSRPPVALQTLLGLQDDFVAEPGAEERKALVGRQVMLRSGGETEIQTTPFLEQCRVDISHAESVKSREYITARGMLRVVVHREQDGWVRLEFTPRVQHGRHQLRHAVGESGWQFASTQDSESFHNQRFSVTLGMGEMAILSSHGEETPTLGRLLFSEPSGAAPIQRLLVVRLCDMRNSQDPFADSITNVAVANP
jgi:hypothetical protein